MKIANTFRGSEVKLREARPIFVDANAGGEASETTFQYRPNVNDWKNKTLAEYEAHLKEAKDLDEIDDVEFKKRIQEGKVAFAKWDKENEEGKVDEERAAIGQIEKADQKAISSNIVERIDQKYIGSLKELRDAIRDEIENLGIKKDVLEKDLVKKQAQKFSREIEKRVKNILNQTREHHRIFDEIEEEEKLAKSCLEKMKWLFDTRDTKKKAFFDTLRNKGVPQILQAKQSEKELGFNIEEIFAYKNQLGKDEQEFLTGITGRELFLLDRAIRDVEALYQNWESAKVQSKDDLLMRLRQYDKDLGRIAFEIRDQPNSSPETKLLADNWSDFFGHKKNDIAHIEGLLAQNPNESDLKLAATFLQANEDEIRKMRSEFEAAREQAAKAAEPDKTTTPAPVDNVATDSEHKEKHQAGQHAEEHEHSHDHSNAFTKLGKLFVKTMTANGNIVWYSFHDIAESFKLIKESWKKYTESASEDKRAPLAKNVMFWKQEVVRRIHHTDTAAERGRAEDLKKTYKNFSEKELLAELKELPAKDRRRAILESLADRGNLRMSKRELIEIICRGKFSEKEWEAADTAIDYTPMREAFKKSIDGWFIGETNYGNELLEKHNAGFSKSESTGKSYASSNESTSVRAEVHNISNQINRAFREGEGAIVGALSEIVDRANSFSDNGNFSEAEIKIDGTETKISRSADMGFVGLLLVNAFVKGEISRELTMKIGKGHEQCFRPFATFQETVGAKEKPDPFDPEPDPNKKRKISHFEYWGWVRDGSITALGSTQIINFFNGRNALAEIATPQGIVKKTIHIATDSNYKVHSGARVTGIEQARKGIGDKFLGYVTKATGVDVIEQATKFRRDSGSATGEIREIASLIKAGVEDFIDGRTMIENGEERYFDSFTAAEVDRDGYELNAFGIPDRSKKPIPQHQIIKMGEMRAERGKEIILRILRNMWLYREDREILRDQPVYKILDYGTTDFGAGHGALNGREKSKVISGTLKVFLETTLGKWAGTADYREIMAAYARLAEPSMKLDSSEIKMAKNYNGERGEINSKDDLLKKAGGRKSSALDQSDY
ncbi:MAG: hypothetical protein V2A63_03380 [Patescibacteria group bacterium]